MAVYLCLILVFTPSCASAQGASLPEARSIDDMLTNVFHADQPGAAVIVTRRGETLLRKGYGMADLEFRIPIEPDMVFRLGSITKQFTAVGILMLEERRKLSVKDPITKFLPDYPTQNQTITVEHLLTHSSGIRSYTSMPEWRPLWRKDFTLTELIDFFKGQPMDFTPDERWLYNNSGYILLGAILEKASGESYEDFIRKNIFEPLGMKSSCYDRTERILPRRVKGYQRSSQGFQNAPYLSMSQPYAAGSLASSVDDLVIWNRAVWSNRLLKKETMARAHTAYSLKDGRSTGYGYGWMIASFEGRRTVEHGGGIHGFATYALSLPDNDIYVAVLTNGAAGPDVSPERLALRAAGHALGRPVVEPTAISLKAEQIDRYVGTYSIAGKDERIISRDGAQLYSQRSGGGRNPIHPLSETEFFFPNSHNRVFFRLDGNGRVVGLEFRPRLGMIETATRTEKAVTRSN
jgi:CubicO group peptidase (beta-lactamase class C family)